MSSCAPKRRLDVRQAPRAAGRRAAVRARRRRRTVRPTPAVVGAFVLVVAGLGAGAVSSETDVDSVASSHRTIMASYTGSGGGLDVDITEDMDPQVLEEQTAIQAEQTMQARANLTERAQAAADQAAEERAAEKAAEERAADQAAEEREADQWVLPVTGYRLSARFGQSSSLWSSTHTGLDLSGPSGSTIVSVAAGTVTEAGYDGAFGNKTVVTLEDGTEVWYAHQSRIAVSPGDAVKPGQTIGYTGATGNVTGPHLHLEIRPGGGEPVDPLGVLAEHGVNP